jgi:hypothetical protein
MPHLPLCLLAPADHHLCFCPAALLAPCELLLPCCVQHFVTFPDDASKYFFPDVEIRKWLVTGGSSGGQPAATQKRREGPAAAAAAAAAVAAPASKRKDAPSSAAAAAAAARAPAEQLSKKAKAAAAAPGVHNIAWSCMWREGERPGASTFAGCISHTHTHTYS